MLLDLDSESIFPNTPGECSPQKTPPDTPSRTAGAFLHQRQFSRRETPGVSHNIRVRIILAAQV